eukprot:1161363-Pelagomonas_calceolata.AAC.10
MHEIRLQGWGGDAQLLPQLVQLLQDDLKCGPAFVCMHAPHSMRTCECQWRGLWSLQAALKKGEHPFLFYHLPSVG